MSRPRLPFPSGFARDARGAAAIELAMIAPIIAGLALVSFGVWERGGVRQDARAALDVAAEYYMNGGGDDTTAQTLANQAWRNKPGDGAISTSRAYKCGTAAAADASTVCSGGRTSAIYVTITATGSDSQTLGSGTASRSTCGGSSVSGKHNRLLASEDGASAVEFALCVPVFLMMVFGIIQFGWTQHTFSSVRFGMERASRALMIDPTLTQTAAQTIVDSSMTNATRERVTVTLVKTNTANGPMGTLSASYTARFGVPGLATFNIPYQLTVTTALRSGP